MSTCTLVGVIEIHLRVIHFEWVACWVLISIILQFGCLAGLLVPGNGLPGGGGGGGGGGN